MHVYIYIYICVCMCVCTYVYRYINDIHLTLLSIHCRDISNSNSYGIVLCELDLMLKHTFRSIPPVRTYYYLHADHTSHLAPHTPHTAHRTPHTAHSARSTMKCNVETNVRWKKTKHYLPTIVYVRYLITTWHHRIFSLPYERSWYFSLLFDEIVMSNNGMSIRKLKKTIYTLNEIIVYL